jgi:putative glutathione S-transferase
MDDLIPTYTRTGRAFERDMNYIPDRILAGESSADPDDAANGGRSDVPVWPVEAVRSSASSPPAPVHGPTDP